MTLWEWLVTHSPWLRGITPLGKVKERTSTKQDPIEADGIKIFVNVHDGDQLTLIYESPNGEEQTTHAGAVTNMKMLDRVRNELMTESVAFRRNLKRVDGDSIPFALGCSRPVFSEYSPVVYVHRHVPIPEATAGREYIGEVIWRIPGSDEERKESR